jgi:hypothetical protein
MLEVATIALVLGGLSALGIWLRFGGQRHR